MAYHIVTGGLTGGVLEQFTAPLCGHLTDNTMDRNGVDGVGFPLVRAPLGEIGGQQGDRGERAVTHFPSPSFRVKK